MANTSAAAVAENSLFIVSPSLPKPRSSQRR
jgi:hypothetical protein